MKVLKRNSFVGGAGIYLFSNILNATIPFILLPILTRYLSPAEYGEVAMFQTLLGVLGAFVGTTFVGSAIRKYYDDNLSKSEYAEFVGTSVQLVSLFSLIVFFLFFSFQTQFSEWLGIREKYVLYAVLVSFCTVIVRLRLGQWQVKKQALKYGALQVSQSFVNALLSLLLVVVFLKGPSGRIDAQIVSSIVFLVLSIYLLKKDKLFKIFIWRRDQQTEILKYGIPLFPHVAGAFLLTSADRFVINQEIGLAEAGIYMVAIQLTGAASIVFDAINKAYIPWLFERLKRNIHSEKKKIVQFTYFWFLLIFLGCIVVFLLGPRLVTLIAGEGYSQAGEVIGLLALGQGFQGMYLMVTNYIIYSKKTGLLSAASIATGLLNLALLIVFVRTLGLLGAALAFAISMGIRFLLVWWLASRCYSMPWFDRT
ncbi:lipopolysaccharide biosynthesis protein [Pseudidiomarina donghaiensis]|uniref:lipopolysaccharide biosynthesis protein n=1 Tax=Pseudidiomarina donghaiensis TaxID=519452 RepID=UPI003A97839F